MKQDILTVENAFLTNSLIQTAIIEERNDFFTFSKLFKNIIGSTPCEYRKNLRKKTP